MKPEKNQKPMEKKQDFKLLVLDDEPFMLKLLEKMLKDLGYPNVSVCQDGNKALEQVADPDRNPDLILLDLNMPEMDGIEFVRKLATQGFKGGLVLVSGEDSRILRTVEKLIRAHNISVIGRLKKPVESASLAAMLATWTLRPERKAAGTPVFEYSAEAVRAAIVNGELVNHYQPKVELPSGRLMGVETLVRWNHPTDGMVMPNQFIATAERHGLIDELTRVVLNQAFAQAKKWQDEGLTLRVAVNISMDNLAAPEFADFVAREAAAAGVMPQNIVLEITESRLMQDLRAPLDILTRLSMKRFQLSIDDFGTGHSSLTQIHDIPFDELKVDRSFVHRAWLDPRARAILEASITLATQLEMSTVAEGVEDLVDWQLLCEAGCGAAQGYFIGKPMAPEGLSDWWRNWQQRVFTELGPDS